MLRTRAGLTLALGLIGCPANDSPDDQIGRQVAYDLPPQVVPSEVGLPVLSNGKPVLFAVPGLRVQVDPDRRNAITAVGACTTWVMSCFSPPDRTLDDCVRSVPACASEEPWLEEPCCPTACKDAYADLRRDNVDPYPALNRVLFEDRTCTPGLTDLVGGGS